MEFNVNAVIVTCNRCELLKQSINALLSSEYQLSKIIVVNNASSDGTKDYLETLDHNMFICINKEINEGGAGGFYYGIKAAYEEGCDFVWLMDDDTIVTPFALGELIAGYKRVSFRNIGFLASNVFWKDDKPCHMNICNPTYDWNEYASDGLIKISHCSFVSMLIPLWVVKDVGYPIKEYFIWGDDGEYSTRILQRYEGYLCGKSIVHHWMDDNIGVDIFNVDTGRINRFYYFYRNWMCTNLMRSREDAKKFRKQSFGLVRRLVFSNSNNKFRKAAVIIKGLKAGKRFNVTVEYPDNADKTAEKKTEFKGIKRVAFRVFRYFGIKYDIRTQGNVIYCRELLEKIRKVKTDKFSELSFIINGVFRIKRFDSGRKSSDFHSLMNHVQIKLCKSKYFAYSIDVFKTWKIKARQMGNCAPDYDLILKSGLNELYINENNDFAINNNEIIDSIKKYVERLSKRVKFSDNPNKKNICMWMKRMAEFPPESLEEALQRVLLMNQILWQTRHIQVGLGRLDYLLEDFIDEEYSDEMLVDILKDFLTVLHSYCWLKSEEMPGDTGQIIILGGLDRTGNRYICNRLTYAFIEAIKQLQIPDPKILLRVSRETPDDLIELSGECIATGIGCPLISNDEKVLPALYNYGYEYCDANDYVTSACWEIIPGNSCEQNNIGVFDFAEAFDLLAKKVNLEELTTWEEFISKFADNLCGHVWYMANLTKYIEWEKDPLLSVLKSATRESKIDISEGGCKYNNFGILSLGLSNTVNSLINIRKYVYIEKKYTLKELFTQRNKNFTDETIYEDFAGSKKHFGNDVDTAEDTIGLTNWLIGLVNEVLEPLENKFGGHIKFGLSSPGYLIVGKNKGATFDGRKDGQPYSVHISNDFATEPTSIVNFAGNIIYGKSGFNGNVVDVMFSSNIIRDNIEKFVLYIKGSILAGIFELQVNVLNYDTLVKARMHPDDFPNLIVRVWGFSAYFKDIPDEYKDYIIERARRNGLSYQ